MKIPKRSKDEIMSYFRGSLNKGDIVIHKIIPNNEKKHIEVYEVEVE